MVKQKEKHKHEQHKVYRRVSNQNFGMVIPVIYQCLLAHSFRIASGVNTRGRELATIWNQGTKQNSHEAQLIQQDIASDPTYGSVEKQQ